MDLATGGGYHAGDVRVALGQDDDAGSDRQDVAPERRELLVRDLEQADPEVAEELPQADRQQRQVDDREVVRDRRDDREQVDELGGAAPVRDIEDPDIATDELGELSRSLRVRSERPTDAQQIRTEPERVAALDGPGRYDPAQRLDAGG